MHPASLLARRPGRNYSSWPDARYEEAKRDGGAPVGVESLRSSLCCRTRKMPLLLPRRREEGPIPEKSRDGSFSILSMTTGANQEESGGADDEGGRCQKDRAVVDGGGVHGVDPRARASFFSAASSCRKGRGAAAEKRRRRSRI